MKPTLEHAGPLQVPVDETGCAVGRPGDTAPEYVWAFHLGLRFTAANGDRVASWQLVRTTPGAVFPFPAGSYAHGVIDFRNGRIVRQALTDAVDQETRERFHDHAQAMEGAL